MIHSNIKSLFYVIFCLLMSYSASAQTAPVSVVGGLDLQRPTTADLLRSRGVDTSQSSLITALNNGNRDVKSLAARQLIENKTPQSVAAVENALSTEKDILTRINIASVLANTEDPNRCKALGDDMYGRITVCGCYCPRCMEHRDRTTIASRVGICRKMRRYCTRCVRSHGH